MFRNRTETLASLALVVALVALLLVLSGCDKARRFDDPVASDGNVLVAPIPDTNAVVDCAVTPDDSLCTSTPVDQRDQNAA